MTHFKIDRAARHLYGRTGFLQFLQHIFENVGARVGQRDVAAYRCRSHQKRAALDAIRHDTMAGAVQFFHTDDADGVAASPFNFCAHGDQAIRQIDHFRFARRIFQQRLTVCQHCGHHQVFRAGDTDQIEKYPRAFQAFRPIPMRYLGMYVTMFDIDFRTHRLQAFDVQVHRARTDGTPARQGNPRFPETRHQRPQHQNRGAHGLDHFVRRFQFVDIRCRQDQLVAFQLYLDPHLLQQLAHRGDVVQIRHIVQMQLIRGQQTGTHDRQRRVLRS